MAAIVPTSDNSRTNFALPGSMGKLGVWTIIGVSVLFTAAFLNQVEIDSEKDEIKLDAQVYLKLAGLAGCLFFGAVGFLSESKIRNVAFTFPAAWTLLIFFMYVVASLLSAEPSKAVVSSVSILIVYLATITSSIDLGKLTTLKTLFYAAALFILGSWVIYFVAPSIGVFEEPLPGGQFAVRMSGLAHPNTLGQYCAINIIIGVGLFVRYRQRNLVVVIILLLAVAALINSYSRSSIIAAVAALAVGYRQIIQWRAISNWLLVGIAIGVLGLMFMSAQVDFKSELADRLAMFSKSGDTEEITSATGRGQIWAKTVQLISFRPLTGHGPTSSKYLLEEYSQYAHNLWLNVALCGGCFSLFFAVAMFVQRLYQFKTHCHPIADGFVTFVLLNGLFENVIFGNLCGLPTICMVLGVAWFELFPDDKKNCYE